EDVEQPEHALEAALRIAFLLGPAGCGLAPRRSTPGGSVSGHVLPFWHGRIDAPGTAPRAVVTELRTAGHMTRVGTIPAGSCQPGTRAAARLFALSRNTGFSERRR